MAKMMLSELIRIELVRLPGLHISAFTSAKRAQKHMFSIWTAPRDPKIKPIVRYKKSQIMAAHSFHCVEKANRLSSIKVFTESVFLSIFCFFIIIVF